MPQHSPELYFGVAYRIQLSLDDIKMADLASDRPLADTREDAVDAIDLFKADYALILDGECLAFTRSRIACWLLVML